MVDDGWRRRMWPPLRVESGELLHLDLLRFVASVGVVLCHSGEFLLPRGAIREDLRASLGSLGLFVDTFFVVSGFVISWIYAERLNGLKAYGVFLHRRLARLLPLHWLTLAIAFMLYFALTTLHMPLNTQPSLSASCVTTAALLIHSMVGCGGMALNNVSWSISAELAMYVLFPLFFVIVQRGFLAGLLLSAALAGAVLVWRGPSFGGWAAYLDVGRAFPAFTFGMTLYVGRGVIARLPAPRYGMAACAVLILASPIFRAPDSLVLVAAYLVTPFAVAADMRGDAPASVRRTAPLGQLTYSIYMIHGLVIMTLVNGVGDKLLKLPQLAMITLALAGWGVIGMISYGSFFWFEQPLRRRLNRLGARGLPLVRPAIGTVRNP